MRRADRLFQIVQSLRRRRLTTARQLAEELEVSERTIYRDVRDLVGSGVPISGEAGVGYALPRGFDLPPMTFNEEEIEALVLGARVVGSWGDRELARAAGSALARIEAVLPDRMKHRIAASTLFAPGFHVPDAMTADLAPLRAAIRDQRKVRMSYLSAREQTRRIVCPLGLFFWGTTWSLAGWCVMREGFRNFRLDRIQGLEVLEDTFEEEPARSLEAFFRQVGRPE